MVPRWHVVSDQDLEHVSGLFKFRNLHQFKEDVEFFLRSYIPVSIQDVMSHLDGARRLPGRCFLATFDDGFREIYDVVAPVLYAQGVPAVFFLTTSAIDNRDLCYPQKKSILIRALTSLGECSAAREVSRILTDAGVKGSNLISQVRSICYRKRHVLDRLGPVVACDFEAYAASVKPYLTSEQVGDLLKKGFAIGAHSIDHPRYSELSLEEQLNQTRQSMTWLSDRYKSECNAFAFPYGDAGVSSLFFQKAFADGRLKVSFGTGGMIAHFFPRNMPRFTMERTDLPAAHIVARQFGRTLLRKRFGAQRRFGLSP